MVGNSPNYSIMPHFTTQSQRQPRFLVWHSLRKTDSIKREHLWLLSSKKFSKMSLSVGSTWRSASFCFISFGVHNVTQHGIMEKGNLKAPPPTAGWPSHALLLSRDSNPVCLSVAQKMHPQLRWAERKITAYVFLLFFISINILSLICLFPLSISFGFVFHFSWLFWIAQHQLF